jgi:hypothetical protein
MFEATLRMAMASSGFAAALQIVNMNFFAMVALLVPLASRFSVVFLIPVISFRFRARSSLRSGGADAD